MLSMSGGGGWVSGGQVIRGCHTVGRADISWHPSVLCTSCSNVKCFWMSHHPRSAPSCITLQLGDSRGLAVGIFTGSPCGPNRSRGGMGGSVGMGQGIWGERKTTTADFILPFCSATQKAAVWEKQRTGFFPLFLH